MSRRLLAIVSVGLLCAGLLLAIGCGDKTIIVLPGNLGDFEEQRTAAQDANAKSLVRNAMTAVESANVDIRDFTKITATDLAFVEPSIEWILGGDVTSADIAVDPAGLANAGLDQVAYFGAREDMYAVGTDSESGKTFGMMVDKGLNGSTEPYVDGEAAEW